MKSNWFTPKIERDDGQFIVSVTNDQYRSHIYRIQTICPLTRQAITEIFLIPFYSSQDADGNLK